MNNFSFDNNELYFIKSNINGYRVSLYEIANWKNGLAFRNIDFSPTGKPIIKIAELNNGITSSTSYTNQIFSDDFLLSKGDLVFSWSGNPQTSIDIFKYNLPDGWLNQHIFKITPYENKINKNYLFYIMKYLKPNFTQIATNKQTTGLGHVTISDIKKISFILPPLEVQKKIAGVLGALDDKIELNNKINQNLEAQAQALFENVILSQPEKGTIGMYCDVKSGFAFKSSWWQNRGIKVIKIKNIENTVLNLNDCSYVSSDKVDCAKDFTVQGGDLLIAMTGATIGKFAIVPYSTETLLVNQRVGKFFLGRNPIEKLPFIYCTLKQPEIYSEIINRGQGSAQANISGSDIMSISCTFPNKKIVDSFNYLTQPIFQKMIFNWYENTRLAELRDNLLPKLMSGEIIIQ